MPNQEKNSDLYQTILILISIILAYLWMSIPTLEQYSLQAFALSAVGYFLIKRSKQHKLYHILPSKNSSEMALATFAFLILVGSTGNFESPLYPFTYVHLYFLTMTTSRNTTIVGTTAIMLFHYALSPMLIPEVWSHLLTIPIVMVFFLLAKDEHEEVLRDRHIIELESEQIELENQEIEELKQEIARLKETA